MSPSAENTIGAEEYERHATWLRQLARNMVADPATLDDIVQETWLSFLRHGPGRDANQSDSSTRPWLRRVLENATRKFYRGEGRRASREQLAFEEREPLESAAELAESADLVHTLMGEVRGLSEPLRSTVLLRYLKGLSAAEIARRSGEPEGTIRWRLSAARDELRERMDRKVGSRERWAALTLPLGVQLKAGSVAASAKGASEFGGRTALAGIAAACALVAAGIWLTWHPADPTKAEVADLSPVDSPTATDHLDQPGGLPSGNRVPAETIASTGATPTTLTEEPSRAPAVDAGQAGLIVRLVDERGEPVPDALLRWTGSRDVFTHTDGQGIAQLVFRPPVSSATLGFAIGANGFAASSFTANIRTGDVTPLGTRSLVRAVRRRGVVRNAAGEPAIGARVWIAPAEGPSDRLSRKAPPAWAEFERTSVLTNRRGEFRFEGAPSLPTRIWTTAEGCWFTVSDVIDSPSPDPIELVLEALPGGGEISGRILDAAGAPLGGVLVRLVPQQGGASGQGVLEVETAADGAFHFLPRGTERYRILVEDLLDRFDDESMEAINPGTSALEIRMTTPL